MQLSDLDQAIKMADELTVKYGIDHVLAEKDGEYHILPMGPGYNGLKILETFRAVAHYCWR